MWPLLIAVGAGFILKELFGSSDVKKKRLFISFAIEDQKYRDFLVAQAKNEKTSFTFIDMSVKEPWDENEWKKRCRTKIKSCDGVLVLLSKKTWQSSGARWEIRCAKEENIPVIGMRINKKERASIVPELKGSKVIIWSWDNVAHFIKKI